MNVYLEELKARSYKTDDLINSLFKAYNFASDTDCFNYIKTNKNRFDYGYCIIPQKLMISTLNKYRELITSGNCNGMLP